MSKYILNNNLTYLLNVLSGEVKVTLHMVKYK